ncbi:2-succinyl-5-enolpyruvyl-6-hydroxy-3-cyclohexene-1-carboxylic-acid synthase [Natrononativus amylolyticus]|uniref:2-succinyl-5-enolpyruvyl-6-hydroxy-3- cyclohexene-1-carboxylic-acid synthase n=1 Tax=Natrononativus amylolyticus TaxID=2963434 RepID=UPI0020CBDA32|nr:2-succinyl-5-enolpyruvyl-6-hydroxy-3-cyclohexene-1-carboxylic-acid synthase [Natrononativus amylolyticus]
MTVPNRATLWGRILADELSKGGLEAVCLAPGSRSTPLSVAFARHPDIRVFSHLDERSAAYFALGRARRTGEPTALVCTSGTAAANFHPAVLEADRGRVPLLVLTADRPPELRDSGANQTVDQVKLYGGTVRWYADLPEPEADERKVRSLRTTAARALAETTGTPAGPVHLNCPFRKPLEPTPVPGDVPEAFRETLAGEGREGPFVETAAGRSVVDKGIRARLSRVLEGAERPLLVAGPADPAGERPDPERVGALARAVDAPVLADPLSELRFGPHVGDEGVVCGGYDAYVGTLPEPDVVLRWGASPTSKPLRQALRDADCRQFLLDPAGQWREATFTATDLLAADPGPLLEALAADLAGATGGDGEWLERVRDAEARHWERRDGALEPAALESDPFEGSVLATAFEAAPDPATIFVSNSMPIRDADRFARPRSAALSVLANRGTSGIDGIVSTALGAGSATDDPLVLVTGDLAYYHDMNGLLALERCGVDATVVLINNDGGGIFHMLPIEDHDPPFTGQFKTPHGLDFEPTGALYDLEFERVDRSDFEAAYRDSVGRAGTQVLEVRFDAESSHRVREGFVHEDVDPDA